MQKKLLIIYNLIRESWETRESH